MPYIKVKNQYGEAKKYYLTKEEIAVARQQGYHYDPWADMEKELTRPVSGSIIGHIMAAKKRK